MLFESLMHIALFTDRMEEMIRFYTDVLGGKTKAVVRYEVYKNRPDRPAMYEIAQKDPQKIFNIYIEVAPGQFVELFPKADGQKEHTGWNEHLGYSHYAFLCSDIFETRKILEERGLQFDTAISKGPSETYQMWAHDPDGNKFEIMQYTENSIQVKGNL
ncbi:MAG: VOC family protein [Solobacterium sp.]|nr:VOC family protein [Solobacterium sp.]